MTLNVNLGDQLEQIVRAKVSTGEYNSASEVVREGLRVLLARDRAIEEWLRQDVAAAYDDYQAGSQSVVGIDALRLRLQAQHNAPQTKG